MSNFSPIHWFVNLVTRQTVPSRRRASFGRQFLPENLEQRVLLAAAAIQVDADTDLETFEDGEEITFEVGALKKKIKRGEQVVVDISSSDPTEGTVTPTRLVFTRDNQQEMQLVTVRGVDDNEADGDVEFSINFSLTGAKKFTKKPLTPVKITNVDDELAAGEPGISFDPDDEIVVEETSEGQVSFVLNSQPTANVELTFAVITGGTQAKLSTASLLFTPANFSTPQTVAIQPFTNDGVDGDQAFAFSVNSTSTDTAYDALPEEIIEATIRNTELSLVPLDGAYFGTYTGSVLIAGETSGVTGGVEFNVNGNDILVASPAPGTGTVSSGKFNTTSGMLNGAVFSGLFVVNPDGSITASGTWSLDVAGFTGSGTWSATRSSSAVAAIQISPKSGIVINEGAQQEVSVVLTTPPTADVTLSLVYLTGSDQVSLSKSSLVFTPLNWNTPQTFVITGVADDLVDGDKPFELLVRTSTTDPVYQALLDPIVTATIHDLNAPVGGTIDGVYTGNFTGTLNIGGTISEVNEPLEFRIDGNLVTFIKPSSGVSSAVISGSSASFTIPGTSNTFTGEFTPVTGGGMSGTGTWNILIPGLTGQGLWTASRISS